MSARSRLEITTGAWLWFFGLWIAGVAVTAAVVYPVKWVMGL